MLHGGNEAIGPLCHRSEVLDKFDRSKRRCHCVVTVNADRYLVLAVELFRDMLKRGRFRDLDIVRSQSGLERDEPCGRSARASADNCANGRIVFEPCCSFGAPQAN